MDSETRGPSAAGGLPSTSTHGFLFADLRDYSAYVEEHGDLEAAVLLGRYRTMLRGVITRFEGAEIRTEGDSFYVVLPSASRALRCGMAIAEGAALSDPPLRVGIGIHAGETADTGEGPVGSAVNIAARVCAQAQAGEVLATETVRILTRTVVPYRFIPRGSPTLKGISEPIAIFRVAAADDPEFERSAAPASAVMSAPVGVPPAAARARLGRRAMLASVVVAALVLVFALLLLLRAASLPGASPSPAPTATAAPQQSPALAPPTGPAALSPDVANLLARLPSDLRSSCVTSESPDRLAGAVAAVTCPLAGAGAASVSWDYFDQPSVMLTSFDRYARAAGDPTGDCSLGPRGGGAWQPIPMISGHVLCYPDAGHARIVWTYESGDGAGILATAVRADADWAALYAWFEETAPFVSH